MFQKVERAYFEKQGAGFIYRPDHERGDISRETSLQFCSIVSTKSERLIAQLIS